MRKVERPKHIYIYRPFIYSMRLYPNSGELLRKNNTHLIISTFFKYKEGIVCSVMLLEFWIFEAYTRLVCSEK